MVLEQATRGNRKWDIEALGRLPSNPFRASFSISITLTAVEFDRQARLHSQ